jgi:LytS/YehU family sensor histidine kinase
MSKEKYNFKFSINKQVAGACHMTLWAYMFLSPMTFWRGTGITLPHYVMISMQPLLLMIVFYTNYLYLAPKFFVEGKHRYDLLINIVMITVLGTFLHYWMDMANDIFMPYMARRYDDTLGTIAYILRDSLNLAVFAAGATALALARRWVTADQSVKELEAARAQAELRNLRNQINPHFLLNTLNNIYALTAFDTAKAQETIQELSKMLRHILYDYQQPTVPIKDEVEFLENYVKLMRIRLSESVGVTFTTDIQDSNIQVAPMIFISLVENAFKHGISPTEPSFIRINITADKHFIYCEIQNSNHPKTESDHSGHGIGLQQVQRRLELAYPNHYTWQKGTKENNTIYYSTITIQL